MNYKSIITTLTAVLFAACSQDDTSLVQPGMQPSPSEAVPLEVTAALPGMEVSGQTRASETMWDKGDDIGIFAVTAGMLYNPIAGGTNIHYRASQGEETQPADTYYVPFAAYDSPIYLPTDGSAIDVYAYYPYIPTAQLTNPGAHPVDITDQATQSAIDFMVTGRTPTTTQGGSTHISALNPSCELLFRHCFTKLQFNLAPGTGMTEDDITGATGGNVTTLALQTGLAFKTKGLLNLYTGDVAPLATDVGSAISPVEITPAVAWPGTGGYTTAKTFEAIILPQAVPANMVTITITGASTYADYTFTIPATTYEPGKRYIYNIVVDPAQLTVTAAIEPWTIGATYNGIEAE